ncbi:hypothetical protein CHS0354_012525 [Potamilus streckersoni]|uniref:Uncharacterized protein n=1 Tax=Potamilus streckersoni TaxID=2493646 RepID=A0AAE0W3M5_9BIVA|nr:hypothetical protein CHS0354_012525 [Potamilus streckersoni]
MLTVLGANRVLTTAAIEHGEKTIVTTVKMLRSDVQIIISNTAVDLNMSTISLRNKQMKLFQRESQSVEVLSLSSVCLY